MITDNTFAFGFLTLCLEEEGYSKIKACVEEDGWRTVEAPEAYRLYEDGAAMYFAFYNAEISVKGVMSSIVVGISKGKEFVVTWQPAFVHGYDTVEKIITQLENEDIMVAKQGRERPTE